MVNKKIATGHVIYLLRGCSRCFNQCAMGTFINERIIGLFGQSVDLAKSSDLFGRPVGHQFMTSYGDIHKAKSYWKIAGLRAVFFRSASS